MNETEKRRETRRQIALDRLGSNHPTCCHCGLDNPFCLERHHVAGRQHHDLTVILCRNCHRILSNDQRDHAPLLPADTTPAIATLLNMLLGLADFFQALAPALRETVERCKSEWPRAREVRS